VHGFNVSDRGEGSTDMLAPVLRKSGFNIYEADYGHLDLFGVRHCNKHIAHMIARLAPKGAIGIGHSNGCAILQEVSNMDFNQFSGMVLINPALDTRARFGKNLDFIHVYSTPSDYTVQLSAALVKHPWGAMGRKGYLGSDQRVQNYYLPYAGHMGLFENFDDEYAREMSNRIRRASGLSSI